VKLVHLVGFIIRIRHVSVQFYVTIVYFPTVYKQNVLVIDPATLWEPKSPSSTTFHSQDSQKSFIYTYTMFELVTKSDYNQTFSFIWRDPWWKQNSVLHSGKISPISYNLSRFPYFKNVNVIIKGESEYITTFLTAHTWGHIPYKNVILPRYPPPRHATCCLHLPSGCRCHHHPIGNNRQEYTACHPCPRNLDTCKIHVFNNINMAAVRIYENKTASAINAESCNCVQIQVFEII
jgi:hypothetical protein